MQQLGTGQARDVPWLILQKIRRAHRNQLFGEQESRLPVRWKMPIAEDDGAVERFVIEIH
ncbi:hypothetical protein D3C72_2296920 [compost metagenome]